MLSYTFLGRSFEFFAGCFLSAKFKDWQGYAHPGGKWTYAGIFGTMVAVFILSAFRQPLNYGVHTFPGLLVNNFFLPVVIVLFFRGLLFENTLVKRLLSTPLFQLLGKSSYAFYLIHVGVISKMIVLWTEDHYLPLFVLLNLLSIGLYLWIEEPLNLWFRRRFIRSIASKAEVKRP